MRVARVLEGFAFTLGMLLASRAATPCLAQAASAGSPGQAEASSVLTNADIVGMLKSGFSDGAVIAVIQKARTRFDLSRATLAELRYAGVPDSVIVAMVESAGATPGAPSAPAPAMAAPSPTPVVAALPPVVAPAPPPTPEPRPLEEMPEPSEPSRPHVSVKLGGGGSYLLVGDYKEHFGSYTSAYLSNGQSLEAPQLGLDLTGDVIFHITRVLGISVGAGYLKASKTSTYGDSWWSGSSNDETSLTLSAIPIRLGVHVFIPFSSRVEGFVSVSPTFYLAEARETETYTSYDSVEGAYDFEMTRDVESKRPGVEGALGLEVNLGSAFSFFFEAAGRYAKLSPFKGSYVSSDSDGRSSSLTDATLYAYESYDTDIHEWVKYVSATDSPPASTSTVQRRNVREANVDFTGAAVRFGFAISF
jgi:hypothetical protein